MGTHRFSWGIAVRILLVVAVMAATPLTAIWAHDAMRLSMGDGTVMAVLLGVTGGVVCHILCKWDSYVG
jgi:hypothetical protein